MEKPYYLPDTSFRFRLKDTDRESNQQRFYDRLTLRGIQVIKDIDESIKEPKKWRGDHTFSPDAATYSLTHFVEPEIAHQHPDWNPSQIHAEAMNRFEKRLKQDLAYELMESQHTESTIHWKQIETKEGIKALATAYGDRMISLQELWEHTKEYAAFSGNPDAYNEAEHKAQIAMQDEFINGSASAYVSVLSHPDSIRYIQVWERNDDGEVVSKQVDLFLSTGKDFSHKDGDALIQNLKEYYQSDTETTVIKSESVYTHFFIQTGRVETRDIRIIARAQTYIVARERNNKLRVLQKSMLREKGEAQPLLDIKKSVHDMALFLREHIDLIIESFKDGKKKTKSEKTINFTAKKEMHEKDYGPIKSALSEWVITQTIVACAPFMPVGAHATLFWFAEIPRIRKEVSAVKKVVFQSDRIIAPNFTRAEKNLGFVRIISFVERTKKIIFIEKRKLSEKKILHIKKKESKKIETIPIHKKFYKVFFEKIKESKGYARLLKIIERIYTRPAKEYKQVRIAMLIWRIFGVVRRGPKNEKPEMKHDVLKEKIETPYENESPVWLLLSIIWYLTMLRESGMVSQHVPPTTAATPIFPLYGVIFTFAS